MDWTGFLPTLIAALLGTGVTAVVGYHAAVARFRKERAIEKQAEWYERAIMVLQSVGLFLESHALIEQLWDEGKPPWDRVSRYMMLPMRLYCEAELYASTDAYRAIGDTVSAVQGAALLMSEHDSSERRALSDAVSNAAHAIGEASSILATEARRKFGFEKLDRGWRWDRERDAERRRDRLEIARLLGTADAPRLPVNLEAVMHRLYLRPGADATATEREQLAAELEEYIRALRALEPAAPGEGATDPE